jgi:hypothetical protein
MKARMQHTFLSDRHGSDKHMKQWQTEFAHDSMSRCHAKIWDTEDNNFMDEIQLEQRSD